MRKTISIERLLMWAYQQERVGREDGRGLWGMEAAAGKGAAGRGAGRGPVGCLNHGGAPGMEQGPQFVGVGGAPSQLPSVMEALLLGATIRSTGSGGWAGGAGLAEAPADARFLHRIVQALPPLYRRVVTLHAERGVRPAGYDCQALRLVPMAMRQTAGEPSPVYHYRAWRRKRAESWLCDLRWEPDPRELLTAEALWDAWWEALRLLSVQCRLQGAALQRWQVSDALPDKPAPLPGWVRRAATVAPPSGPAGFTILWKAGAARPKGA